MVAKRLGARLVTWDGPTGLADPLDLQTIAVFAPLDGAADAELAAWAAGYVDWLTRRV